MVATDQQVIDVVLKEGLLDNLNAGSVICIASSVAPETCRHLEAKAAEKGVGVLDTPVVLGQKACDEGTMTVFVGGEEKWFRIAEPVLKTFGRHVIHLGPSGTGQIAKTANNMLLWACMSANYEVLTLAKKLGADLPRLIERPPAFERRQLVARQVGREHRKMGREGHGRRDRAGPRGQGAGAAQRPRRSAHEGHEQREDAGADEVSAGVSRHSVNKGER